MILSFAIAPSKRAHAQEKPCDRQILDDGRILITGKCIININEGGPPLMHLSLMEDNSEVLVTPGNYSIELQRGAVRGLKGTRMPSITVHGTEHSVHADVQEMCVLWREDSNHVTIQSERGETLVQTSFNKNLTLEEGEWVNVDLQQPSADSMSCSVRWSGKAPPQHGTLLLAIAMSAFLLRSRRKHSS